MSVDKYVYVHRQLEREGFITNPRGYKTFEV